MSDQINKLKNIHLNESNFLGIAAEALSTAHKSILSDQPMGVSANPATRWHK